MPLLMSLGHIYISLLQTPKLAQKKKNYFFLSLYLQELTLPENLKNKKSAKTSIVDSKENSENPKLKHFPRSYYISKTVLPAPHHPTHPANKKNLTMFRPCSSLPHQDHSLDKINYNILNFYPK